MDFAIFLVPVSSLTASSIGRMTMPSRMWSAPGRVDGPSVRLMIVSLE